VIGLDATLIAGVAVAGVPLTWVLAVAMAASAARIGYAARALRPALAH
jgi:orotate phosphoribosyltransferase